MLYSILAFSTCIVSICAERSAAALGITTVQRIKDDSTAGSSGEHDSAEQDPQRYGAGQWGAGSEEHGSADSSSGSFMSSPPKCRVLVNGWKLHRDDILLAKQPCDRAPTMPASVPAWPQRCVGLGFEVRAWVLGRSSGPNGRCSTLQHAMLRICTDDDNVRTGRVRGEGGRGEEGLRSASPPSTMRPRDTFRELSSRWAPVCRLHRPLLHLA